MKKKYRLLPLVLVLSAIFGSCENNFDPELYASFPVDKFPETKDDYISLAMQCYLPYGAKGYNMGCGKNTAMASYEAGSLHMFDTPTDLQPQMNVVSPSAKWKRVSQANWNDGYNASRGTRWLNHMLKIAEVTRMTKVISVIESAPESILDKTTREKLLGEVRLCRGLQMYTVLHLYGPMPMIVDPALVEDENALYEMARPPLDTAVARITRDYEYAVEHIADAEEVTDRGRFHKDYARVCLIRHCLNEGSHVDGYYDRAVELCEELIEEDRYSLFKSGANPFSEQFASTNKFNCEVIMAISCSPTANGTGSGGNLNNICKYTLPKDASLDKNANPEFEPARSGWYQYFSISPKFYNSFETGDLRRATIVTSYKATNGVMRTPETIGKTWDGYVINKFRPEAASEAQPMDIPTARWADVLLMYAEALTRRDGTVSKVAVEKVNEVRARAGLAALPSFKTVNADTFLDTILDERGFEFFFEGFRKIDLIRFNQYARRTFKSKGIAPTHQYIPVPSFAVEMAASRGIELTQTYTRPGWAEDLASAK